MGREADDLVDAERVRMVGASESAGGCGRGAVGLVPARERKESGGGGTTVDAKTAPPVGVAGEARCASV